MRTSLAFAVRGPVHGSIRVPVPLPVPVSVPLSVLGVALALAFAVVLAPPLSPTARAQDVQTAQRDFASAGRAFDRGAYEEALRLFRSAFDAAPRAAVRFNIAVCLERLGRLREAWLEVSAAIEAGELGGEQLARAESEAARLRALLAVVEIGGTPAGADVRVDGVSVCTLPCTVEIDPGAHTISAHADGRSAERGVRVDRGQRLPLELAVPAAATNVVVDPAEVPAPPDDGTIDARVRPDPAPERDGARGPGWLTAVGAAVAAVGVGGIVGFGLYTQSLHDQWLAGGPESVRDEGLTMRAITNVSIGVAALGGALVLLDLLLAAGGDGTGEPARATRSPLGTVTF